MFVKSGKVAYYFEASENTEVEKVMKSRGRKVAITSEGKEYTLWPISPKRVSVLEYILNNPNTNVSGIAFGLQFPHLQEVTQALSYFKHKGGSMLVVGGEWGKYSIMKEKETEVRQFIRDYDENKVKEIEV